LADSARPTLVVFAAGKGTRLRPMTDRVPKAMIPVLDIPLIDLALRRGESVDWARRVVNVSGPAPGLREHLQADLEVFDEGDEPLGTAATLRYLFPRLTETVVTYNCDLVSNLRLATLLQRHAASGKGCTLAVRRVETGADIAVEEGRMRLIDRRFETGAGLLYLGAACFDRDLLEAIPPAQPLGLTEGLLRRAIGEQLAALFPYEGYAQDAGTIKNYLRVSLDALDPSTLDVDPPGVVSPDGWYLGPSAVAQEQSLGRGAIVLKGAEVKPGAKLEDSIVWPGSLVPEGVHLQRGVWLDNRFVEVA
jgi:mannose-1-phosphate guanylyltransferase